MRALHLLGLRAPRDARLRYRPPTDEPLVLPSWLPPSDREVVLAFYQQILGDEALTLTRIEVDWDYRLVSADARYLAHTRLRHGATRDLVVVRVRRPGVDVQDVVQTPEIAAFQYVAIACDHPIVNESVGALRQLTEFVAETARDLYEELSEELGLREDGVALIEPLVRTLLSPIPVLETYNALIRLHGEPLAPEAHRDAIYRSVLGGLLDDLPAEELVGLAALVLHGAGGLREALGEESSGSEGLLRARMVTLDGRLTRWARFLEEPSLRGVVEDRIRKLAAPARPVTGLDVVEGWLSEGPLALVASDPIRADVLVALAWINEGKLGRAAETLARLEVRLEEAGVSRETRGDFWHLVGLLRGNEGQWSEAEPAFRRALDLLDRAGASATRRGATTHMLARALYAAGRRSEAEQLFRQALQLSEEGGDTLEGRSITMDELARVLRDEGRWSEAEPLFRKALQLMEECGSRPEERGITMHHLALGLRDHGGWPEAEPLFRRALQFKEEGGAKPESRAITLRAYAVGLRRVGRIDEAIALDEQAAALEAQK